MNAICCSNRPLARMPRANPMNAKLATRKAIQPNLETDVSLASSAAPRIPSAQPAHSRRRSRGLLCAVFMGTQSAWRPRKAP